MFSTKLLVYTSVVFHPWYFPIPNEWKNILQSIEEEWMTYYHIIPECYCVLDCTSMTTGVKHNCPSGISVIGGLEIFFRIGT